MYLTPFYKVTLKRSINIFVCIVHGYSFLSLYPKPFVKNIVDMAFATDTTSNLPSNYSLSSLPTEIKFCVKSNVVTSQKKNSQPLLQLEVVM